MAKPYSDDLRERVVRAVEGGSSRRDAARIRRQREFRGQADAARSSDELLPGDFGGHKEPKLAQHEVVVRELVEQTPSATLLELQKKLNERGVEVGKSSIGRFLKRLRISYKKNALRGRAEASGRSRRPRRMAGEAADPRPSEARFHR